MSLYHILKKPITSSNYDLVCHDLELTGDLQVDGNVTYEGDVEIRGQLTVDEDIISNGNIILGNQKIIYRERKTYSFNPSTTSTIYTQYIGTFTVFGTVKIIFLSDSSTTGSGSEFNISRSKSSTPVVYNSHSGTSSSFYTIHYRIIDFENYELFFTTSETANQLFLFNANINTVSSYVDNISSMDDVGIIQCIYGLSSVENGSLAIGQPNPNSGYKLDVNGKIFADDDIESFNSVIADNALTISSCSLLKVASGSHSWTSGSNPLVLDIGLDGDGQFVYKLSIQFTGHPTNTNNCLGLQINNDTGNNYSSSLIIDGVATDVGAHNGETSWRLVDTSVASRRIGFGEFLIWVSKTNGGNQLTFTGQYCGTDNSTSDTPILYVNGGSYYAPNSNTVGILTIDVIDSNYNDWSINYLMHRIA